MPRDSLRRGQVNCARQAAASGARSISSKIGKEHWAEKPWPIKGPRARALYRGHPVGPRSRPLSRGHPSLGGPQSRFALSALAYPCAPFSRAHRPRAPVAAPTAQSRWPTNGENGPVPESVRCPNGQIGHSAELPRTSTGRAAVGGARTWELLRWKEGTKPVPESHRAPLVAKRRRRSGASPGTLRFWFNRPI